MGKAEWDGEGVGWGQGGTGCVVVAQRIGQGMAGPEGSWDEIRGKMRGLVWDLKGAEHGKEGLGNDSAEE